MVLIEFDLISNAAFIWSEILYKNGKIVKYYYHLKYYFLFEYILKCIIPVNKADFSASLL